jgi:heat shock protein HslJ
MNLICAFMKTLFTALFLLLLASACKNEESPVSLTGTWKLHAFQTESNGIELEPADLGGSVVIQLTGHGSTGKITGHTVNNRVFGNYQLQPGHQFLLPGLGSTEVYEPGWGERFLVAMQHTRTYWVSGNQLILSFDAANETQEKGKMIFYRQK